ncbi:metallo-beta-lactamase superfamily protein [Dissoconium aciculare CBS 342.82]|uniref:Metallo-beta-lactamase superfamily protein n=1 Tax=Dissoconium aciculare CBS 342.82 TaxID=1314786 RepID=A0A6J3M2Z5_9PEZI|nr:metallo-beta-lactamase superfamily protein [Dissoconium aciculare CBS 342.82]KAF1821312.1 metallo-beta-lactamase superfamily protein [Dissoconium aciculare CBS 342.82]
MAVRIPVNYGAWDEYLTGQAAMLPELPDVEQITPRVARILGANPGQMQLQGTNTYLVGSGPEKILIDTGEGSAEWIARIISFLLANDLHISRVLLTHWHGDHTGGVPSLLEFDPSLVDSIHKHQPDSHQQPIHPGQTFSVPGATLRAVHTPGHAVDHMAFMLEEENALFTGDNVLGHGFSVVQDLGTYMDTLRVMTDLGCAVGYPGHGAIITDLPTKMREYTRHKQFRVTQVHALLVRTKTPMMRSTSSCPRGGLTLAEIAASLYGADVPSEIVQNALAPSLIQVLWKLAEDRKVGFEPGDVAKRRWFAAQPAVRSHMGMRRAMTTAV